MRKVMKRVCALFLALMMLMGTFSLNVFAGKSLRVRRKINCTLVGSITVLIKRRKRIQRCKLWKKEYYTAPSWYSPIIQQQQTIQ